MGQLIECCQSNVPLDKILGLSAFSLERMDDLLEYEEDTDLEEECTEQGCTHDHGHGHSHGHSHGHAHEHAELSCEVAENPKRKLKSHNLSGVSSVGITLVGDVDPDMFNTFVGNLLRAKSADIYRSKGVISLAGHDAKFVMQGVHD